MANKYFRTGSRGGEKEKKDAKIPLDKSEQETLLKFFESELTAGRQNNSNRDTEFGQVYDLLHCVRKGKPNDWEPDIFLPEFTSRLLTQIGNFVAQYFKSRDFVEADIDTDDPTDLAEAKAASRLLNQILNDKDTHYFHKLIRILMFTRMAGYGVLKLGYEQKVEEQFIRHDEKMEYVVDPETQQYLAEDGQPLYDFGLQKPMVDRYKVPVYEQVVVADRPVFDVFPNNCVYMSPEYAYTMRDKNWVILESEAALDVLETAAAVEGYFNLDKLYSENTSPSQEHQEKTYGKGENLTNPDFQAAPKALVRERWGKFPVVVKSRNLKGVVDSWDWGFGEQGKRKDNAEPVEFIITTAKQCQAGDDSAGILIGMRPSPYSKRPLVRFLCYIDPLKDNGFGDGEINKELQVAINDNFNLSNYRVMLATTPAFKYKRFSGLDNPSFAPNKGIPLENMEDLQEMKFTDNISGAMLQHSMLSRGMDYAMALNPQDMGMSPERRETATMASYINQGSQVRSAMGSLTLEFIGFTEFYDTLLSLVNDFMLPETLDELLGDQAKDYNPKRKDKFRPVSQALEEEYERQFNVKMLDQVLGRVVSLPNPKTPMVVNMLMGKILERMGDTFKDVKRFMFEDSPEAMLLYMQATSMVQGQQGQPGGPGMGAAPTPNMGGGGAQNQMPGGPGQQPQEMAARENATGAAGV